MKTMGKIVAVCDLVSGDDWQKRTVVIEREDGKKLALVAWGKKAELCGTLALETVCSVTYDVTSREFEGRWYTEATLSKLVPMIPQDLYKAGVELPPAIDDSDEQAEEKNEE